MPADRPDRVEKAIASAAHAVIVDLEDGVAPGAKADARSNLAGLFSERHGKPVYVRVNAGDAADLDAVAALAISGVVVPKVARPEDVPATPHPVHCLIESAAGVEAAYEIAGTHGVAGISLGESDLRSETGALEAGLDWARGRLVNAAVAAGLPRPPQSEEVERARETVTRLEQGAGTLGTGEFVDAAMLGSARQTLALADTYGSSHRPPQGRNT